MAARADSREEVSAAIIALEQAALGRWCTGDPSGFLEISAPDVVYFDSFLARRVDGLEALSAYYDSLRGTISASRWEIVDPHVQAEGDVAVLTFNFVSWGGSEDAMRWHCTEVYRHLDGAWRIIQTHWSVAPKG
jgi:ketosteroid isomerase-like protein